MTRRSHLQLPGSVAVLAVFSMCFASAYGHDDAPGEPSRENLWTSARPDGHAPIGVMGEHTHGAGEWMLSYRYMFMDMDGNASRGGNKSTREVLTQFPVAPTRMTMEMHMLGAMYAPSDRLTLMVMAPIISQQMEHVTRSGVKFRTRSSGPGDIRISGLYRVLSWSRQQIHLNAGLSLPTGSIDEKDDTPAADDTPLPYPMQLGSGTFDLLPGITYLGQSDHVSWGAQAIGTIRVGRNSADYSLGERVEMTAWAAYKWTRWLSNSIRLVGSIWGDIDGNDEDLNSQMVPTADPTLRGGERIDIVAGVNLHGRESWYRGQRLAFEFGIPIYQALDGPQLETDWFVTGGWQYAW